MAEERAYKDLWEHIEELDKAVNGLLNTAAVEKEVSVETPVTPEPTPEPPVDVPASVSESTPEPVTRPLPTTPIERPATVTPAARRTVASGRFMDMVHPSSDMRNKTTPVEPAPEPTPAPRPVLKPIEVPAPEEKPAPELPEIDSPFLPGTKVEKRPLGGVAPVAETPLLEQLAEEPAPQEDAPTPEPEAPAQVTEEPAEEQPQPEQINYSDEEQVASDIASIEHEVLPSEEHTEEEPAPLPPSEPSVPASIPQQYEEAPAATPQQSGAIFDTEAYHQPFASAPKTGANLWLILLWVGGLLVLGAAAGVAVYLFVLPML